MAEGQCASELLPSATPVEAGAGGSWGSKATGSVVGVETPEAAQKGHVGIRASPPTQRWQEQQHRERLENRNRNPGANSHSRL